MPLTPKQTKILKAQLKKLDTWWKSFDKNLYTDILNSASFQEFLERTKDYTTNNILEEELAEPIADSVIRASDWSKLKNYALVQETIRNTTMDLVKNVGEDLKTELRLMAEVGFNEGLSSKELARIIVERDLPALKITDEKGRIRTVSPKTRSKTIARTETNRSQNIINYVQAKEDKATGFKVICRSDCCKYCAEKYHDLQDYQPAEEKTGLLTDGVIFNIDDVGSLPPFHPNCRCSAEFIYDTHY